jgi:hypothetical protein
MKPCKWQADNPWVGVDFDMTVVFLNSFYLVSANAGFVDSNFRPIMPKEGTFDISRLSSSLKGSSSNDNGSGVWSCTIEPNSGAGSCSNCPCTGGDGSSEISGCMIIGISSDISGSSGCNALSGVIERIFSRIYFPSSTER